MAALDDSPSRCQGQSWALWAQRHGLAVINDESEDDDESKNKHEGDAMKLRKEDMALFGFCPAQDEFYLVVCELCGQVVKPQALKTHIELRHSGNSITKSAGSSSGSSSQHFHPPLKSSGREPHLHSHQHGSFPASSGDRLGHANKPTSCSPKHNANPFHHSKGGGHCRSESKTSSSSAAPKKAHPLSTPVVRVERMSPSLVCKKANSTMGPPGSAASPAAIPVDKRELPSPQQPPPPLFVPSSPPSPNPSVPSPNAAASHHGGQQPHHHHFAPPLCPSASSSPLNQGTSSIQSLHKKAVSASMATSSGSQSSESKPKPAKSKSKVPKERKLLPCKDRVYDADKHCGVYNQELGKPCTRSLTCKTHSLALRRNVVGRRKNFDELLSDHRAAKEALIKVAKAGALLNASGCSTQLCNLAESEDCIVLGAPVISAPGPISAVMSSKTIQGSVKRNSVCMNGGSARVSSVSSVGSNSKSQTSTLPNKSKSTGSRSNSALASIPRPSQSHMFSGSPSSTNSSQKSNGDCNLLLANCSPASLSREDNGCINHHPRPAAVCTYNSRQMGSGFFVCDRRLDSIRAVLRAALGERFTQPPPIKKLCVESMLPPVPESSDPSDPYCFLVGEHQASPLHGGTSASTASPAALTVATTAASISSGMTALSSTSPVSTSSKSSQPKTGKGNNRPLKGKADKGHDGANSASTNHVGRTPPNSSGPPPAKRKRSAALLANKCNPSVNNVPAPKPPPHLQGVSAPTGLLSMSFPLGINAHLTATVAKNGGIPTCGATIQTGHNHTANSLKDINLVVTGVEVMNGQLGHGTGALLSRTSGPLRTIGLASLTPATPGSNRASITSAGAKEGKGTSAKRAKASATAKAAKPLHGGGTNSAPTLAPAPGKWNVVNNTTVLTGLGAISNANLLSGTLATNNHVALAAITSNVSPPPHAGHVSSINFRPSSTSPRHLSSPSPLHNGLGPSQATTPITSFHHKNMTNHILPTTTATYTSSPGSQTSLSSPDLTIQNCEVIQHKGKGSRQNSSTKSSGNQKSSHQHHPFMPSIHSSTALPLVTGKTGTIGLSSNSVSQQVLGVTNMGALRLSGTAAGKHGSQGASTPLPLVSPSPVPYKILPASKSQNTKSFVMPIDELRRPSEMQGSPTLPT